VEAGGVGHDGVIKDIASRQRTCLVVLGMHRSGTSALTRVLNIFGATLPRNTMAAGLGNETGHWEPQKLVDFHDEMLAELDSSWHDWHALDISKLTAQCRAGIKARIAEIIAAEYGEASLFVVKDPRICRFAPLFLEALTEVGITARSVLIFRNPLEVAQSLERRDGMPREEASLLWLRHVLDAEIATRGTKRAVLSYGDLLTNWKSELQCVSLGTGCIWPNPVEDVAEHVQRFLDPGQRHHVLSAEDIMLDSRMCDWVAEVYGALHRLRQSPAAPAALSTIDRVRREFDKSAPVIGLLQRELRVRLETEIAAVRAQLSSVQGAIAALVENAQEAAALTTRLIEARAQIAAGLAQTNSASHRGSTRRRAQAIDNIARASTALAACAAKILHPPTEAVMTVDNGYGSFSPVSIVGNYSALQSVLIAELAELTRWLERLSKRLSSTFDNHWRRLIARLREYTGEKMKRLKAGPKRRLNGAGNEPARTPADAHALAPGRNGAAAGSAPSRLTR
jgi:hypothetical protein